MAMSVYFDWNATAALDPAVKEAMLPWLLDRFGNASSRHAYGRNAHAAIEEARAKVAHAVGAAPKEIIFTSGGSEANNLFLKGMSWGRTPGVIGISAIEHPCVREPARQLQRVGWDVRSTGVDEEGRLDRAQWQAALEAAPQFLSVIYAHNETGVIQDMAGLADDAKKARIPLHTDAVQALGKIPLDFRALGVAAMTVSAHKIGGPQGIGALVAQSRLDLQPLVAGGGQEKGIRSGTENVAGIVGFGEACRLAITRMAQQNERLGALLKRIEAKLHALDAVIFSEKARRLCNTLFFALPGIEGETFVTRLDEAGFACASGSACSSAHPGASKTLLAMGVDENLARCAVRVSLGWETTDEEVARFENVFPAIVEELKRMAAIAV